MYRGRHHQHPRATARADEEGVRCARCAGAKANVGKASREQATPKLPKLPDDAYAKPGVHCQRFREEDAKRPGGELMGGVLEPSQPEDREKEPLLLGVRTASDAQWRIGGTAKVGLVVRNRTGSIGGDHRGSDVKFSYTGRLDNGLSVVAVDEAGKEHTAAIALIDGLLTFQQMLLPVSHVATIKEFTIRFDAEKRDVSEPHVAAFHLPPGKYKLRCKWNDARPDVAHEGEWTGELVNEELEFTLTEAISVTPASEAENDGAGTGKGEVPFSVRIGSWKLVVGRDQDRPRSGKPRHWEVGTRDQARCARSVGNAEANGRSRQCAEDCPEAITAACEWPV